MSTLSRAPLGAALVLAVTASAGVSGCRAPTGTRAGLAPAPVDAAPEAAAASDPCATAFTGPQYGSHDDEEPLSAPKAKLGQPATMVGVRAALCSDADCQVTMLFPAGGDEEETWFVSRVDSTIHTSDAASGCGQYVDYYLVVAKSGSIVRVQHLVETGETCMHWRGEEVTVGPNLFVWRDSGYGSPIGANGYEEWKRRNVTIELSTLRVNGCTPPPEVLRGPLVRHMNG